MVLSKGNLISICPNCRTVVNFSKLPLQARSVELPYPGVEAVGVECPHCQHFQTLYWLNPELKVMQNPQATRKERRRYEVIFRRFQQTMRKKHDTISTQSNQGSKNEHSPGQVETTKRSA